MLTLRAILKPASTVVKEGGLRKILFYAEL
jgi:hypothetical protein